MTAPALNLARGLCIADRDYEDAKNRVEQLLSVLFPGWQSWRFSKPDGIDVYGAFDSAPGAAALRSRGFLSVTLHDHRAREKVITCRCIVHEWPVDQRTQ